MTDPVAPSSFDEHEVVTNGITQYLRVYGDPDLPVLVALHGWPDSSRGWHAVAGRLAGRFRVLVPDNRGFGRSDKPVGTEAYRMKELIGDVLALADWAGADSFVLAGHDFGASVTWATCMFAPERIRRAVAMCAPHPMRMHSAAGDVRQMARSAYAFLMNVGERGEALLRARDFGVLEEFAFGRNPAIPPAERAAYRAEWEEPGRFTAMAEWYRAHYTPDLLNPDVVIDLPPVRVPLRYVHGIDDFAFIPELAESNEPFMAADYDHVLVPGSHWLLYEQPDQISELIADWFTRD